MAPPAFVRLAAHPLRWALLTTLAGDDLRVRELTERVGRPQNLVSYHLRLLRDGGLVTATRSSFDGRDSYYHLDLDRCSAALAETGAALHPAVRPGPAPAPSGRIAVLFVCTGNSARSPIAEALLHRRSGGRVAVASAGTRPKSALDPDALRVLREGFGIDVAGQRPRSVDAVAGRRFDHVITLCDKAREACPEFPHHPRRRHWSVAEPSGQGAFRRTAAEIDTRVRHLLPDLVAAQDKEARS
ncbi:helix-turn-helix domain-containing protein [Amycolatopsis mongoliensis]|uniref:Helix-turn-helix domain-containing protein n=1 Tax=Amycolatopsis mongoliensis TaxID=715475 RepID=A0A9Y2JHW6_9PSEU|nr:ArsR family transcriptional regulator [Amycolatopsis sp. 4-36]WIX98782.1 helix-turn-helix domain-containing protein [Amycolatopsis sp. 4-36]